jgi:hypothetical protein
MSEERLKFQGRLLEKQNERDRVELRIKGLVASIRNCIDPFADIEDLQAEIAAQQTVELANLRIHWNELGHEIVAIRKALGM